MLWVNIIIERCTLLVVIATAQMSACQRVRVLCAMALCSHCFASCILLASWTRCHAYCSGPQREAARWPSGKVSAWRARDTRIDPELFWSSQTNVCLLVGCLTSQQHASVSQGRICSDHFTCCHTEKEVADPTFYLTQSQYTDTRPTSPSADPMMPGTWQGGHWSANFTGMTRPRKNPGASGIRTRDLPISRRTP